MEKRTWNKLYKGLALAFFGIAVAFYAMFSLNYVNMVNFSAELAFTLAVSSWIVMIILYIVDSRERRPEYEE